MQVGQNFWLSVWTDATTAKTAENERLDNRIYMTVYFLLGAIPIAVQVDCQTQTLQPTTLNP